MARQFERYLKLKRSIQDWIAGSGTIFAIAHQLNISSESLKELLNWNGLSDITGCPDYAVDVQDVLNLIFLTYTFKTLCPPPPPTQRG